MLLLLIDHGLVLISLFVLTLFLREAAERERTHHLLEKQAAEWKETKRRLYLEVRHHEP